MTLEWQDVVAVVALIGYGLMQVRKVLLNPRSSRLYRVTHVAIHVGAAFTGAVLTQPAAVGLALGLAGAGAIQFLEQFLAARLGLRASPPVGPSTEGTTPTREESEE
jgi:hypothetical protein